VLTPVEIRNRKFKKGWRGYHEQDVNGFMNDVCEHYERLYRENIELRESIQRLEFELARYRKLEDTLNQSLVVAQQAADELRATARRQSEAMIQEAQRRVGELLSSYQELLARLHSLRTELRAFALAQVDLLDRNEKRIEEVAQFFQDPQAVAALRALASAGGE
jgi:cell division initiation protein